MAHPRPARMVPPSRNRRPISKRLVADNGHSDFALASALVEIAEHDLLPGADIQLTRGKRKALYRSHERATQVRVAVVIAPARVMGVLGVGRCDLLECPPQVGDASGLELEGGDAERGAPAGDVDDTGCDLAFGDDPAYVGGDVEHVASPSGADAKAPLVYGHTAILAEKPLVNRMT